MVARPPTAEEIAAVRTRAPDHALVVVGTVAADANPAQADLVTALLATGGDVVTVALRIPWDLSAYPGARTHLCPYGVLRPSLDALAAALFEGHCPGVLPTAGAVGARA